jgi:hypothetical protein
MSDIQQSPDSHTTPRKKAGKVTAMSGKHRQIPERYSEQWITALDNRTALARAVQARLGELMADLGNDLSYQRKSLCKRVVFIECLIEQHEAAIARGDQVYPGPLVQAVNSLTGLFRALGFDRVRKDVSLADYIKAGNK